MQQPRSEWSVFGVRPSRPRPNYVSAALSLIFALQTFLEAPASYPAYMIWLAVGACSWISWAAWRQRAGFGILFPLLGLFWLNPLLGFDWFNSMGVVFFFGHTAMALALATAAYTFQATERD